MTVPVPQVSTGTTIGPQAYAANIFGGFKLVSGQKDYEFFNMAESQDSAWGKFLTNLREANRIPNGLTITAHQYGPRIGKVDGTVMTAEEEAAADLFMRSLRLELFVGSNDTRVLDISGLHFQPIQSGPTANAGSNAPKTFMAWLPLNDTRLKQTLPENSGIKGRVSCTLPTGTPAALGLAEGGAPKFIWHFVIAGEKACFA